MERMRAAAESERYRIREVPLTRPLRWLARGAGDLARCPLPGLAHGLAAAAFAAVLLGIAHDQFWLLSGAFTGFLIVAPIVATALYRISRGLQHGQRTTLAQALSVWWPKDERLVVFGALLALAGTGWVLTSAALITGYAPAPVERPADFLRHVVLNEETLLFEFWLLLGGVMAAPVFASAVIALADYTGDAIADYVEGDRAADGGSGVVNIYAGRAGGPASTPTRMIRAPSPDVIGFGATLAQ
jgi:uncharacterized membrane protein